MPGRNQGRTYEYAATSWSRIFWHVLADIRGLRQCSARRGLSVLGIGFLGVSFAFGLTVLTMAYAVGHVSGGHFNCAVTIGLWAGGRFKASDVLPYVLAQVAGAIAAAAVLYAIASGKPDWVPGGFASNGYGDLSPGKYGLASCFLIEVIATFFFLYVIIGTTSKGAAVGFAGIPIGLCLTLIHLFLIPVTNASVNPARSTGPALFAGPVLPPRLTRPRYRRYAML